MRLTWLFWLGLIVYFISGYLLFTKIEMTQVGMFVMLYTVGILLMGIGVEKEKKEEDDYEEDEVDKEEFEAED